MRRLSPAERILHGLGVRVPGDIDLETIAWELGVISIKEREMDGCEARIVGKGDRAVISVDPRPIRKRQRFSVAHELGHWVHHKGRTTFCAKEDIAERRETNNFEQTANSFAADLLLPPYLLEPLARPKPRLTTSVIREMADTFDATLSATALRLVELGQYPALAICYNRQDGRRWFARSPLVPSRWFPQAELNHETYAFDLLHGRGSELPSPRKIGADAFFDRCGAERYEVQEQSFSAGEDTIVAVVTITDQEMLDD